MLVIQARRAARVRAAAVCQIMPVCARAKQNSQNERAAAAFRTGRPEVFRLSVGDSFDVVDEDEEVCEDEFWSAAVPQELEDVESLGQEEMYRVMVKDMQ